MQEFGFDLILILVLVAFLAGFMDSIAGGGGLIVIPVLLIAGFSPVEALGTNKLQGLFGSGSATIAFAAKGHVDLKRQLPWALLAFVGAVLGAALATVLPGDWLAAVMPFLLVAIAVYFLMKPNLDDVDRASRITPFMFGLTVPPLIGFYDGVFGPGAGSFFMLAFVALAGYGVLKATAHTKLLNFASNCGGFIAFAIAGVVVWKIGLLMGLAQFFGARLGAYLAMRVGARVIKPLLISVSLILAVRLLFGELNSLREFIGL
ncbi:TSUP family transporter [Mesorhizobium sp. Z1-4]|uniref:TSUP family transporter n=1 Tax=Mesorhizobium sp. Z1-4 TaxID=2448478 RepID=UPI000FD71376|nr:TSUP family transporter [Mesorhizobium sp. Z1-4]